MKLKEKAVKTELELNIQSCEYSGLRSVSSYGTQDTPAKIKNMIEINKMLKAAAITLGYMIGGSTVIGIWGYLLINHIWIAGGILCIAIARAIYKEVLERLERVERT